MRRITTATGTHQVLARVAQLARRQHGLFSKAQAFEAGLTIHQLKHRLRSGEFVVVDTNVYRFPASPITALQRSMAACLAGPAVASHRSAGVLWDFPGMPTGIVEVTALRHLRRHSPDVVWHESYHLTERDITELHGIPVTRPVRTFLDLAGVLDAKALEIVYFDGLRRNLLSIAAIWRRWEQLGPLRHGAGKVRALLEQQTAGESPTESDLETLFWQLVREFELPAPTRQVWVHVGATPYRIDFVYPERRLGIELLGRKFHFGEPKEVKNRLRRNDLGTIGWIVLEITWDDMTRHPDRVVRTIRNALRPAA
jgi:very-short-patch-repair endonuclease